MDLVRRVVARVCGSSEEPERVLTRVRVKVEGSEEEGIQVIWRGEVRSMVVPGRGEVNVRACVEAVRARRRRVGVRILGVYMCVVMRLLWKVELCWTAIRVVLSSW